MAEVSRLTVSDVLARLREAGQDTLPGGGAEVLSERVRKRIEPKKGGPRAWLDVHREAHRQGFRSTATMMYGHVEEPDDIVDHWDAIRELQDEYGGFTAFVPCPSSPPTCSRSGSRLQGPQHLSPMLSASALDLTLRPNPASWFRRGSGPVRCVTGARRLGNAPSREVHAASDS